MSLTRRAALAAAIAAPALARAQTAPLKIGMVTTLSGPGGYLGQDIRDAFQLAIDGGMLGGTKVELLVEDDGLKPAQAKQIVNRFLKTEHIRLFTGIVFSNVAEAVVPDVLEDGGFYISANAGPAGLTGKACNPNYFVVSWQNDNMAESAGEYANRLGYKRMYVLSPNYQAGKDSINGFRRTFKGEVVGETYTRLDQTDFSTEMAQIRAAAPDAVFQFHPGGLGIAFIRQYNQAGLGAKIPMVVSFPSLDSTSLAAVGEPALGMALAAFWNTDFDNQANKEFVAAFMAKYNRTPTFYAAQGYDTARLIASALKSAGGMGNDAAFRTALHAANFASVRGKFRFGPSNHPIQDWYGIKAEKDPSGKLVLRTHEKILSDHGDFYAAQCNI